ncbi:hypothetical protein FOA52_005898 [Chlamydomonas sp. UWO 241]|nr:hypothetical protein FOA52_005823 [Chlamydomonas sp. UWO 241]KAG1661337.1 hypothetical protein FOA52_005898 [Chlamydomonas sp. UWO 241]
MVLLNRLHKRFNTEPGEEHKWLPNIKDRALAESLEKHAFRPQHPKSWLKKPREWLSNVDIEFVLKQYELHLGDALHFRFVGTFPSDFSHNVSGSSAPPPQRASECISQPMCELNVEKLISEGVHRLGIVFNLDPHDKGGSHWTACFVCLDPTDTERFGAYYFDSLASPPMPSMVRFMARMRAEADAAGLSSSGRPFRVEHNRVRKQFKNTECGIYSLLFIILSLQTEIPYDVLWKHAVHDDDTTNAMRKLLFRPPE